MCAQNCERTANVKADQIELLPLRLYRPNLISDQSCERNTEIWREKQIEGTKSVVLFGGGGSTVKASSMISSGLDGGSWCVSALSRSGVVEFTHVCCCRYMMWNWC
ncbi:uncharacterized [Tachysurus ichikawai]